MNALTVSMKNKNTASMDLIFSLMVDFASQKLSLNAQLITDSAHLAIKIH
jgi:hypothetical protein